MKHTGLEAGEGREQVPDEDYASVLARFACGLSYEQLPAEVIAAVKVNLLDTWTCAAAGSSADGVDTLHGLVSAWAGAPQATVWVMGDRVPAHHAAWVNGAMAHARDYDDTHDAAVLHAGVSVVPAACAAAELRGGVSGRTLVAAVAAGLECISRLGVATTIGITESGYMYTALFGHFAATLAAARVLELDHAATVNALGIAYSQVAGNHQVTRDAALTKRMQPGFAALSALLSVQLAQQGVRGAQATFEGEDGFFRVYLRGRYDPAVLRRGLGVRFECTNLSYKPYPCCRFNHAAIEAALLLRPAVVDRLHDVRCIRVSLNQQAYQAVCTPVPIRRAPQTIVQAQFSIPYTVAVALVDGEVGLGHFTGPALARTEVLSVAARVQACVDADIEREGGRSISPVIVELELTDGRVMRQRIDQPLGHPQRPMTAADRAAKARDCFGAAARPLPATAYDTLQQRVEALEDEVDAMALLPLFSLP